MIRHAWTVLCSKTLVDRDSNNVSMDVLERMVVRHPPLPEGHEQLFVNTPFKLASLWYHDGDEREHLDFRTRLVAPNGAELGSFDGKVELTIHPRLRSFTVFPGLPTTGSGRYMFIVETKAEDEWETVAEVPFELILEEASVSSLPPDQTQSTSTEATG